MRPTGRLIGSTKVTGSKNSSRHLLTFAINIQKVFTLHCFNHSVNSQTITLKKGAEILRKLYMSATWVWFVLLRKTKKRGKEN